MVCDGIRVGRSRSVGAGIDLRGQEHLWSHRPRSSFSTIKSGLELVLMLKLLRRDFTVSRSRTSPQSDLGPFKAGRVHRSICTAKAIEISGLPWKRFATAAPKSLRLRTVRRRWRGSLQEGAFRSVDAGVPMCGGVPQRARRPPKGAIVVRPAVVEAVVLPPIDTSAWTLDTLDDEILEIRARYVEILGEASARAPGRS
jgi:putative phosphoserine phosphatase/1-acylglycerol-3-phosphate O-acyltransferase